MQNAAGRECTRGNVRRRTNHKKESHRLTTTLQRILDVTLGTLRTGWADRRVGVPLSRCLFVLPIVCVLGGRSFQLRRVPCSITVSRARSWSPLPASPPRAGETLPGFPVFMGEITERALCLDVNHDGSSGPARCARSHTWQSRAALHWARTPEVLW